MNTITIYEPQIKARFSAEDMTKKYSDIFLSPFSVIVLSLFLMIIGSVLWFLQANTMNKIAISFLIVYLVYFLAVMLLGRMNDIHYEKSNPIGLATAALAISIENDSNWRQEGCQLVNTKTGAMIWIANGIDYIDYYPATNGFNSREKSVLFEAIQIRLAKNATLHKGE